MLEQRALASERRAVELDREVRKLRSELDGEDMNDPLGPIIRALFDYWRTKCRHSEAKLRGVRYRRVRARLREGYEPDFIRRAIDGAARAPFINDAGTRFDDLELICRSGPKLESFAGRARSREPSVEKLTGMWSETA